jgi:DNA uptake protein ComE-like DNA-binding protein
MRPGNLATLTTMLALIAAPALAQTPAPSPPAKPSTPSPAPITPATKPAVPAATTAAPSQSGLIDINAASKEQLDALPQIGPARAEAIIKGRPYRAKNDLLDKGILPPNAYEAIQDRIIAKQKS